MKALLHYLALRSSRDRSLASLLLFPVLACTVPLLGAAGYALLRGRGAYPLTFDPRVPPATTAFVLFTSGAMISVFVAGMAGFWFLRTEIADRSVGSLVLAARTQMVALAVTLCATAVGISAYLLVAASALFLTGSVVPNWPSMLLVTVCCSAVAASLGFAMVTISSETSMLIPVVASATFMVVGAMDLAKGRPGLVVTGVLAAPILLMIASSLLERRCAA